jgi:hypothetical protein
VKFCSKRAYSQPVLCIPYGGFAIRTPQDVKKKQVVRGEEERTEEHKLKNIIMQETSCFEIERGK